MQLEREHGRIGYLRVRPQSDPTAQLAAALDRLLPEERSGLLGPRARRLAKVPGEDPARTLASSLDRLPSPLLLFADQFEGLFTQTPSEAAAGFRTLFAAVLRDERRLLVLTLRSEFMKPSMDWLGGPLFERSLVTLSPIARERLNEIIVGPANDCGFAVEPALVTRLVADGDGMSGAPPLLALALERLFAGRDPVQGLTLAAYEETGGLGKAVETAAAPIDEAIDADPALARACERLFRELATVVDDLPTRRTARVAALRSDPDAGKLVERAHETLLQHWERLQRWCQRCGHRLALRREAEQAAADCQKARNREEPSPGAGGPARGRPRGDLLRWTWERQKPALEALLALHPEIKPQHDPRFADAGIDAWRSVGGSLGEPLSSFLYPEPLQLLAELESDATPHHRREEIGLRLNHMGDPRRGVGVDANGLPEIDWVDVAPGKVTLETDPPQTFAVRPFQIARYPVTWRQYLAFVEAADRHRDRRWWRDLRHREQFGAARWAFDNHPAVNVPWFDAMAFCRSLGDRLAASGGRVLRLPTEAEWQWVAQAGAARQEYPWWPSDWRTERCNSATSGIGRTVAAGMYPLGAPEPWPAMDLCGNVGEWCFNGYEDPVDLLLAGKRKPRVLRGGSWYSYPRNCRAAARDVDVPGGRYDYVGFRVCLGSPIGPRGAAPLATVPPSR